MPPVMYIHPTAVWGDSEKQIGVEFLQKPTGRAFRVAERRLMRLPPLEHSETATAVPHAGPDCSWRVLSCAVFQRVIFGSV